MTIYINSGFGGTKCAGTSIVQRHPGVDASGNPILTQAQDISVVLSGGVNNLDPNTSLGGDPSETPVSSNSINNLFDDVTPDQSTTGLTDYRCIYVFNDGVTPVHNIQIFITAETDNGSDVNLGILFSTEIQRLTFAADGGQQITGGSVTLSYENIEFTVASSSDLSIWAGNLQTALLSLVDGDGNTLLEDISVVAQNVGTTAVFDIQFNGKEQGRSHEPIQVISNTITPGPATIIHSTPQSGSPINTIAPDIEVKTTPPGGVLFIAPSVNTPISLPKLLPTEGFPMWFQRVTAAGATPIADDSVSIRIRMQTLGV